MSFVFSSASHALFSAVLSALLISCASSPRRFPLKDTMWKDDGDFREFAAEPEEYEPATFWEVFDGTMLRPIPHLFAFDVTRRAKNVNAWDEVPDSSWFTNRLQGKPPTPTEAARGACDIILDPNGPFEVIGGKPDGLNPGFLVKTAAGKKYFFKFDGEDQPERATAADVIGSKIWHFLGYPSPCNQIVYFNPKVLKLSPKATIKKADGTKVAMTQEDVNKAFQVVKPNAEGKVRGFASEFLSGKPLGPWRYEGRRGDDPNDVIDHEDRREVRGGYVLNAWTNHFDARDQNTLTTWIDENKDGKGYVRHNIIDFGDCFGSIWAQDEMSRRHGQTYYLKAGHVLADFATLGVIERPWDRAKFGPAGSSLGYYNAENFVPDEWHAGYPLTGMLNRREEDDAWMARLIAEMTDAHMNAIIDEAKLQNKVLDREMRKAILGRRDKVLARWLGKLSPLSHPAVEASEGRLCVRDLAVYAKVVSQTKRVYKAELWQGEPFTSGGRLGVTARTGSERVCVELPKQAGGTKQKPAYLVLDVTAGLQGVSETPPLRLHLYHFGGQEFRVAGVERPESSGPP